MIPRLSPDGRSLGALPALEGADPAEKRNSAAGAQAILCHAASGDPRWPFHSALACGFDLTVTIDSDGQFNPAVIPALIAPVTSGEADFAVAPRFKDSDVHAFYAAGQALGQSDDEPMGGTERK